MADNRYVNTSPHQRESRPYGTDFVHVMETEGHPRDPHFQYEPGMFVYVHDAAYCTNPLDATECCVLDVTNAPLEIAVHPCNHPEDVRLVRQDQLSAPIWV